MRFHLFGSLCVLVFGITLLPSAAAAQASESYPQLELSLLAGGVLPSQPAEQLDDFGLVLGTAALVRTGEALALGLALEHVSLGWRALGAGGPVASGSLFPDDDGSVTQTLIAALARWYWLSLVLAQAYAQLGIGYGVLEYSPDHPDCGEEDGVTPQIALGVDLVLTDWLRAGASMSAHPAAWGVGCNEIAYPTKPPNVPFPKLLLAARLGLTTVWDAK